jgi:rubrerythrin
MADFWFLEYFPLRKKLLAIAIKSLYTFLTLLDYGGLGMAVFTCEKCGNKVDTRCKPKKCPACSETGTMSKVEAPAAKKEKKK